jgi:hypothetical protein
MVNMFFEDNQLSIELTIIDNGWTISSVVLTNLSTKKTSIGQGLFRSENNIEWYEFQTDDCNYDFDVPTENLILNQFDCKNKQSAVKFTLTKKVANWNGTYHNSDNAILVISDYKNGETFNYKLAYGGTSSCSGIELSGLAKLASPLFANAGNDKDYPITLELKGNEIIFSPSCCDGMVGMDCLKFFDTNFTKK